MTRRLVLASSSPYRRALLERLGVEFDVRAPDVDEDQYKAMPCTPREIAERLANAKADAVATDETLVLGSDQVAVLDGEILGKPGTRERACAQLERLAGRTHSLITAVCLLGDRRSTWAQETHLTMRALTRDEIVRYVDADLPLDCAGSYKIESLGIALFERIESDDMTAIEGLPLLRVAQELRRHGWRIP